MRIKLNIFFMFISVGGLTPGFVLGKVGVFVAFRFGNLEYVALFVVECRGVYPEFIFQSAEDVVPFVAFVADTSVDMFEATPAAKVPYTVSFGEKFDDAFLFDCVEEVVAVAAFVGCQCRWRTRFTSSMLAGVGPLISLSASAYIRNTSARRITGQLKSPSVRSCPA